MRICSGCVCLPQNPDFWKPGNPDFGEIGKSRFWEVGKSRIWGPGNPEFWDLEIQNFGIQKMKKIKVLKNQIHSAQNVGKVWISRKKILPAPFGAIPCHFLHGPKKSKKCQNFAYFPWWMPYFPWWATQQKTTKKILCFCLFSLVGQWAPIQPLWAALLKESVTVHITIFR